MRGDGGGWMWCGQPISQIVTECDIVGRGCVVSNISRIRVTQLIEAAGRGKWAEAKIKRSE
jgi:hypothetical protein